MVVYVTNGKLYMHGGLDTGLLHILATHRGMLLAQNAKELASRQLRTDDGRPYRKDSIDRALRQLRTDRLISVSVETTGYFGNSNRRQTRLLRAEDSMPIRSDVAQLIITAKGELEEKSAKRIRL